MMWLFSGLMYFIFLVMGLTTGLTPMLSRQATPFGVAVARKDIEIEKYKKRYLFWNLSISIIAGLPLLAFPFIKNIEQAENISVVYVLLGIIFFMIFSFGLYLKYRSKIIQLQKKKTPKERQREKKIVVDMNYHQNIQTKSQFTFFIWQFAIIVIPILLAFAFYDRIPTEIPIQWDMQFKVGQTVPKNIWTILALPGIQLLMIPILNYSNYAIVKSKQRLSPLDPQKSSAKSRQYREAWSNLLFSLSIGTQLLLSSIYLYSLFSNNTHGWFLIVLTIVYLIFTITSSLYLSLKYGQAGEKLLEEDVQFYEDPDEESQWKYGVFYFNRTDPSIFVEKRFGIGTTLNYAQWGAWLFIVGIVLFVLLTFIWSYFLLK